MSRPLRRDLGGWLFGALVACGLGLAACESPAPPATSTADDSLGSVSVDLTLGGQYQIDQVSYDISGNGFHEAAALDVTSSTTISTVVTGIPFGTGYTIALTAQDQARALTACAGSSTFDVTGPTTVPVSVHMTCHLPKVTTPPPPPTVPVPRGAVVALGGLLLVLGLARTRRAPAA